MIRSDVRQRGKKNGEGDDERKDERKKKRWDGICKMDTKRKKQKKENGEGSPVARRVDLQKKRRWRRRSNKKRGEKKRKKEKTRGKIKGEDSPSRAASAWQRLNGDTSSTKLAAGLRSVARNYKATRLLTRPG